MIDAPGFCFLFLSRANVSYVSREMLSALFPSLQNTTILFFHIIFDYLRNMDPRFCFDCGTQVIIFWNQQVNA